MDFKSHLSLPNFCEMAILIHEHVTQPRANFSKYTLHEGFSAPNRFVGFGI